MREGSHQLKVASALPENELPVKTRWPLGDPLSRADCKKTLASDDSLSAMLVIPITAPW